MEKDYVCLAGESDMGDFTAWWENHLPSYLIIYQLLRLPPLRHSQLFQEAYWHVAHGLSQRHGLNFRDGKKLGAICYLPICW